MSSTFPYSVDCWIVSDARDRLVFNARFSVSVPPIALSMSSPSSYFIHCWAVLSNLCVRLTSVTVGCERRVSTLNHHERECEWSVFSHISVIVLSLYDWPVPMQLVGVALVCLSWTLSDGICMRIEVSTILLMIICASIVFLWVSFLSSLSCSMNGNTCAQLRISFSGSVSFIRSRGWWWNYLLRLLPTDSCSVKEGLPNLPGICFFKHFFVRVYMWRHKR